MANVQPLKREDLPQYEEIFQLVEAGLGFVPRSLFTMARNPQLFEAFVNLVVKLQQNADVDPALRQLVAHIASTAAGCQYCQAHTGSTAARLGTSAEKIAAVWEFETSALFSDAERAALRLARDAAVVPNASTPEHFAKLRKHYSDRQIVDIVAMISLFGYLNRWNDTMAKQLEDEPLAFARDTLSTRGWTAGKHDPEDGSIS